MTLLPKAWIITADKGRSPTKARFFHCLERQDKQEWPSCSPHYSGFPDKYSDQNSLINRGFPCIAATSHSISKARSHFPPSNPTTAQSITGIIKTSTRGIASKRHYLSLRTLTIQAMPSSRRYHRAGGAKAWCPIPPVSEIATFSNRTLWTTSCTSKDLFSKCVLD